MCTSNVASNTQWLVSIGSDPKWARGYQCNGKGNIQWCRQGYRRGFLVCTPRTDDGEVVKVDDDLVAMMSGGVLDAEPSLISRNTLGNRKNANSKSQMSNVKWW